eukprot:COSAG03_NODE_3188_length_2156_cov_15.979055_1_plen_211_part_00
MHAAWSGLSPSKHSSEKHTPPTTTSTTSSPSATSHSGRTSTSSAQSVSFISPLFSKSRDEETFLFTGAGARSSRSPFQASDREAINAPHSRPLGGVEWRAAEQPPELAGQSDPLDDGYRTPPASPSRRLLSTGGSVSSSPASSAPSAVGGGLAASNYSLHCELPLCLCLPLSLSLSLCRSVCDPQWAQQVWRRSHLHGRAHRSSRGAKEQ